MAKARPTLRLIRGLPGSGKSTMAQAMTDFEHIEADQFFVALGKGKYRFVKQAIGRAHADCFYRATRALFHGRNVVVSNTFTQLWEMQRYIDLAKTMNATLEVIEAKGEYPNVHGVPDEKIAQMRARWESFEGETCASC